MSLGVTQDYYFLLVFLFEKKLTTVALCAMINGFSNGSPSDILSLKKIKKHMLRVLLPTKNTTRHIISTARKAIFYIVLVTNLNKSYVFLYFFSHLFHQQTILSEIHCRKIILNNCDMSNSRRSNVCIEC